LRHRVDIAFQIFPYLRTDRFRSSRESRTRTQQRWLRRDWTLCLYCALRQTCFAQLTLMTWSKILHYQSQQKDFDLCTAFQLQMSAKCVECDVKPYTLTHTLEWYLCRNSCLVPRL